MSGGWGSALSWPEACRRNSFRGFTEVVRVLAQQEKNPVTELVVDVNQLCTGISCHLFDQPCAEYDNFAAVLKTPKFRRLDLALTVGMA